MQDRFDVWVVKCTTSPFNSFCSNVASCTFSTVARFTVALVSQATRLANFTISYIIYKKFNIFFQAYKRMESSKSCNLIGSESGWYFTILPANITRAESLAASFTRLVCLLFVNEQKPSFSNHFSFKTCAVISIT